MDIFSVISTTFNPVNDTIIAILFVSAVIVSARNRIPRQTVKDLKELVATYEKRIVSLEDDIKANYEVQVNNVKSIADLQGQVKVYKELPLQELAEGIKEVVKISNDNATSNKEILKTLQITAAINAEDRGTLTGSKL